MKLEKLIAEIEVIRIAGDTDGEISSVTFDSREVAAGSLFIAVRGTAVDGHAYIPAAVEAGASAIVCEELPGETDPHVTF
ncbi:MAG: Mur ligase domain-containing protein, partial [Bacteroidales bacterium]|nr:Mur ligase domain-containing protein [Bacteroidales bacterium]